MKDHTVPVSNQTTLAGARPLQCPHHPHLHGCQEGIINPATSTFRLVLGGATLLFDEDPGGRPVYLLVVVLCCVARTPDVNVIYVRRLALPLMATAPHPLAVALSYTILRTQYRPQSCDSCDDAQ